MEKVSTFGKMVGSFMANGRTTTWKVREYITGQMAAVMKASITMIRNVATVFISGPMAEDMRVGGSRGSSMALALIWTLRKKKLSTVSGRMVRE